MRKDIIYKTLKRIQPVMLRAYATTHLLRHLPPQTNIIASAAHFEFVCLFVRESMCVRVCAVTMTHSKRWEMFNEPKINGRLRGSQVVFIATLCRCFYSLEYAT